MPPTRRRDTRFPEWWNPNVDQRFDLAYRGIFTTRDMIIAANNLVDVGDNEIVAIDVKTLFRYVNDYLGGFSLHLKTAFLEPNVFVEKKRPHTIVSCIPSSHPDFSLASTSKWIPKKTKDKKNRTKPPDKLANNETDSRIHDTTDVTDALDADCYGWESTEDSYPPECYCPVSMEVFCDPVVASDGFTYEKKIIDNWLAKSDLSPMTGEKLSCRFTFPNIAMKQWIERLS
jgi:hypothetical protein